MRKALWFVPAITLAAACSAGAHQNEGSHGGRTSRDFQVGAFDSISLAGSPDVIVTVGGQPSVRAEGDAEMIERLDIRVEGRELKIGTRRGSWSWNMGHHDGVTIHVTVPSLRAASIGGSGDMRIDRVESPDFRASIAGSGDMEIGALRARQAGFSVAGSGGIRATGAAERTDVSIAGSGDVRLDSLQTRNASVSVMGSGEVTLHATESVDGSVMGSGDVTVAGPARCSVRTMGSGEVRCTG